MKLTSALVVLALAFAAAQACTYTCPDGLCATSLANCSCTANTELAAPEAAFDRTISTWTTTVALTGSAYAQYNVSSGNCSTFDFAQFVTYSWSLSNGTAVVFSATGSSLSIPARTMTPGGSYTLTLTARGLLAGQNASTSFAIAAVASTPRVSIAAGGSERRYSNLKATTISASVADDYPVASPSFAWTCTAAAGACPNITNNTVSSLTIAAGTAAGVYEITFTYRGVASKLEATFVAATIPAVAVVQTSVPVVGQPLSIYLTTQTVSLSAAVSYAGNVTYSWYRGATNSSNATAGEAIGNARVFSVSAATLDQSGTDNTMVENRFSVVVADATNGAIYGEAALVVYVLPAYDLTVTVAAASGANTATALLDKLVLSSKSQTLNEQAGSLPYGLAYQISFSYLSGAAFLPLSATPSGSNYTAVAPIPAGNETGNAVVTFQGQLRIGGVLAASDNTTFTIVRPDATAAADSQIQNAASITDPVAAVAATANIATLMASTDNATLKAALGAAALAMLTNSITSFESQTADQQAAIFDMCTSAVGSQSSAAEKAALEAKTLALMTLALAASSFDPKNGQSALTAIATVTVSKSSVAAIANLAAILAKDPTIVAGTTRVVAANGVNISAARELASDIGGFVTSSGAGNSLTFPSDFALDGVSSTDTLGVSSTSTSVNPYGGAPQGAIVSYEISVNNIAKLITGLAAALSIEVSGAANPAQCAYWDTVLQAWSTVGVVTKVVNGVVVCETTHLTAFGTFAASSASAAAAALPLLVAVLAVAFQAVL